MAQVPANLFALRRAEKTALQAANIPEVRGGVLEAKLVRGTGLKGVDMGGKSDPYVILYVDTRQRNSSMTAVLARSTILARVCKKTTDPTWNQLFKYRVEDPAKDTLKLTVMDKDKFGSDDLLGYATVRLDTLVTGVETEVNVALREGIGSITLLLTYRGKGAQPPPPEIEEEAVVEVPEEVFEELEDPVVEEPEEVEEESEDEEEEPEPKPEPPMGRGPDRTPEAVFQKMAIDEITVNAGVRLFAVAENQIWAREGTLEDQGWTPFGHANIVRSITTADGFFYTATEDNGFWMRPMVEEEVDWIQIGHCNDNHGLCAIGSTIYAVGGGQMWYRDADPEAQWQLADGINVDGCVSLGADHVSHEIYYLTADGYLSRRPASMAYTGDWIAAGTVPSGKDIAIGGGMIWASTHENRLICRSISRVNDHWTDVQECNGAVGFCAFSPNGNVLHFKPKLIASAAGELWYRDAKDLEMDWVTCGPSVNTKHLCTTAGHLFGTNEDNQLWMRPAMHTPFNWSLHGQADRIAGLAALRGKLYACADDSIWTRPAHQQGGGWVNTGVAATGVRAMAADPIRNELWICCVDGRFHRRDDDDYESPWTASGVGGEQIRSITIGDGKLYGATDDNRLISRLLDDIEGEFEDIGHANTVDGLTFVR